MDTTLKLLASYAGRDKIMRTTAYVTMYLSGRKTGTTAEKLAAVTKQINAARVVLRLFDDLPMLVHTINYGTGTREKDGMTRFLSVMNNIAGLLYFPIEHLAWASDHGIVNMNSGPLWTVGVFFWAASLVLGILRSIRKLIVLRVRRLQLLDKRKLEAPEQRDSDDIRFKYSMKEISLTTKMEFLTLVKCSADLMNAVNWLPEGILWAGKLPITKSGICGIIASVVGLYQLKLTTP